MIAVRMALAVFIAVCTVTSIMMHAFNGASLLGVIALLALVATSERVRALGTGLIADAYGDAAAERTVLDDLDRPALRFSAGADFGDETETSTPRVGGWYLTPDGCDCPVDHTDACPLDDDVDHPAPPNPTAFRYSPPDDGRVHQPSLRRIPMSQKITYSTPVVHRSQADSVIEFDIHHGPGRGTSWEALSVKRVTDPDVDGIVYEVGDLVLSQRGDGILSIPAEIVPVWLAEIDRVMSGDDPVPFEPVSASAHVVAAEPAPITGIVPAGASL